jgi:hypothetical protein
VNEQQNESIPADEFYREQVHLIGYELLSDLHDLTFHQGDGQCLRFEVESFGVAYVVENLRRVTERAQAIAAAAIEALHSAEAARTWMVSGRPMRCATCGYDIDTEVVEEWWICRDVPEHTYCHRPDAGEEDQRRAWVVEDDELGAYCEDRERAGGPFHGDEVELRYPDGRSVYGTWYIPGLAPLSPPIVLDNNDAEVDPAGAQVSVSGLGEDFTDYSVPSLEDLARGAQMAAALAGLTPLPDSSGQDLQGQDVEEEGSQP